MTTELHFAGLKREQSIVLADAHVKARVVVGAALAYQNFTSVNQLTAETLDAQALRVRITTVVGRTETFLMCHCYTPYLMEVILMRVSG